MKLARFHVESTQKILKCNVPSCASCSLQIHRASTTRYARRRRTAEVAGSIASECHALVDTIAGERMLSRCSEGQGLKGCFASDFARSVWFLPRRLTLSPDIALMYLKSKIVQMSSMSPTCHPWWKQIHRHLSSSVHTWHLQLNKIGPRDPMTFTCRPVGFNGFNGFNGFTRWDIDVWSLLPSHTWSGQPRSFRRSEPGTRSKQPACSMSKEWRAYCYQLDFYKIKSITSTYAYLWGYPVYPNQWLSI